MKKLAKVLCVVLSVVLVGSVFAACGDKKNPDDVPKYDYKQGTFRTFTTVVPSTWNILDSIDQNNQQIMSYLSSGFYEYDYEFDEAQGGKYNKDGSINLNAIVDGKFEVKYSAATKLEDMTSEVDAKWGYTDAEKEAGAYAWKLTLRDDLKWDDGTPIDATDFVYSMKQQLDPKFHFQRANSYYGAVSIKGAKNYAYQGQKGWYAASTAYDLGAYTTELDEKLIFSLGSPEENAARGKAISYIRERFNSAFGGSDSVKAASYAVVAKNLKTWLSYITATPEEIMALEGKTFAEIKANPTLKATWDDLIGGWQTDPGEEMHFMITEYEWPEWSFDNVGLYSPSKYEIVICFTTSEEFLKEDGSLSYLAAYTMQDLPLVHKAKFEASINEPSEGSTLYTSSYCSDVSNTASWGPYKLTQFQSGKSYTLEKNEHWYGYNLRDNANQYNVTKITCDVMADLNTQWMNMLSGKIDEIGIDVTHADDYRGSKYAYFTPGTYTFSLHFFSGLDQLKLSGRNNGILAIQDFRKAVSLAMDRDDYAAHNTTAYRAGYGYLNSMYYYDVEEGGVYRNTDQGKKALLRAYGYVEEEDGTWSLPSNDRIKNFELDDAYDTLKGYDMKLAKECLEKAYTELTKNAAKYGYDAGKKIQLKFGTSADNESTRREFQYLQEEVFDKLTEGTSLAGKIELVFDASFGNAWSEKFIAGEYEICTSAWGSAAFDPFYFIGAYIDPANAYTASYFDVEHTLVTHKMPAGNYAEAGKELTLTVMDWYNSLNGYEGCTYDWGPGKVSQEVRLDVLAMLEEYLLTQYFSIPNITQNTASILGAKFSYASDNYNTFMGYGGMRYMQVNYTDAEWDAYVQSIGGNLEAEYKKS
ncbi:MAG: hypothetical protein HFK10_04590 [Clostridia bacterium]|jgi:oligopeptide transport system substrate-binding protein|nr:hypothetical protein [Clostridia bacterium]